MQHANTRRAFALHLKTEVVYGPDRLTELGSLTHPFSRNVLLVTDRGLMGTGIPQRALESLEALNIAVTLFDNAQENPTETDAEEVRDFAASAEVTGIVAIGGGSVIDTAKGANFLLTNGGKMRDYRGYGHNDDALLPLIAVPTTAGTGSEVQSYALISHDETHQKMACGASTGAPMIALLDPTLLLSAPPHVIATAGIDALTHAVESYFTKTANPFSQMFSTQAFENVYPNLRAAITNRDELEWFEGLQLGACYAGIAIEHSMLGGAHAAANPITAHFPVSHGQAVGLLMPHVVDYNAKSPKGIRPHLHDWMSSLDIFGSRLHGPLVEKTFHLLWDELLRFLSLKTKLSELGIEESDLPGLSEEAAAQWTAQHNPVPLDRDAFLEIYRAAL